MAQGYRIGAAGNYERRFWFKYDQIIFFNVYQKSLEWFAFYQMLYLASLTDTDFVSYVTF